MASVRETIEWTYKDLKQQWKYDPEVIAYLNNYGKSHKRKVAKLRQEGQYKNHDGKLALSQRSYSIIC